MLACIGTPPGERGGVRLDLLRATHAAGCTFWAWDRDRWLAALVRPHTCQHAMAVAYLLCGVHDLHLHRPFMKEQEFAAKVFGAAAVPAAADRVLAELRRWGYSGRKLGEVVPRAVARLLLLNGRPRLEDLSLAVLRRAEQKPLAAAATTSAARSRASWRASASWTGRRRAHPTGRAPPPTRGSPPGGSAGASGGGRPRPWSPRRGGRSSTSC